MSRMTTAVGTLVLLSLSVAAAPANTPILTYHDFIESRDANSLWFDCTTREFENQIVWLRRHGAHFVTLDQIFAHLTQHAPLPTHAIALTAADGYEGFYLRAVPVLRRYRIPLTMFVHTQFVGDQHGRPKMTWDQLRELEREGLVSIESQTATHPPDLRALSNARVSWEMKTSKQALESRLGVPIRYAAYPNGKFDSRSEAAARAAGYVMAFSEVTKPCELSPSKWAVNRYVHTKWRQAWRDSYGGK